MTNKKNSLLPFNIIFLDEPLPSCFHQRSGMTFKDLLSVIGREFKNTYVQGQRAERGKKKEQVQNNEISRKEIFDKIREELGDSEYERFLSVFKDLETETDYQALKSSAYIGNSKNARNHMGANNLLEWMFSADGRIDACFIQKDGVKFIFIMDVRLSNHYNKKDAQLHELNRDIAKVIADSFDGKNGNDPQGILKNGLLAYQHELLQNTNTVSAQFETLLITIEQLIASNDSVLEKIELFKRDLSVCLRHVSEEEFDNYIKKRLITGPIKNYQKELFDRLYSYEYGKDKLTNEIENTFTGIQAVKTLAPSFFNRVKDLLEKEENEKTEREWAQDTLDCFRVFHKMSPSYIYILEEEIDDFCSDIESDELKQQLEYFVGELKNLKVNYRFVDGNSPYKEFKKLLNNAKKSRFQPLNMGESVLEKKDVLVDLLKTDISELADLKSVDKIAAALIKIIVEEEYSSVLEFVQEHKSLIPSSNKNSVYRQVPNPENTFNALLREILKNKKIQSNLCQKYPYLTEYVDQLQKEGVVTSQDELNTVCEYYREYAYTGDEEFFVEANKVLKTMPEAKRSLYKGYLQHVYSLSPENSEILELATGSLNIIDELKRIETIKDKIEISLGQEEKKITPIQQSGRFAFENIFSDFLMDMGNVDLYEELQSKAAQLTQTDLEELRKADGEIGEFIKDYIKYSSKKKKPAFSTLIENVLKREEIKRRERFEQALSNYFVSLDRKQAKTDLGLSCLTLEPKDVDYFLTKWKANEKQNELKILFLQTYKASSFEIAMKRIDTKIIKEKKAILDAFIKQYHEIIKEGNKDNLNDFVQFILQLKNVDLDMLMYIHEEQENAQVCSFLENISKIKSKNNKNATKEIQETILSTERRSGFKQKMYDYFIKNPGEETKEILIQDVFNLNKSDIDAFFSDNTNSHPFKLFFGKLRNLRNKLKAQNMENEVSNIIDATKRRLYFYNTLYRYLHNAEADKSQAEVLADFYLAITPQDQKDIEQEQSNQMLFPVLFSRLNAIKKETGNDKQEIVNYFVNNRWEQDFYFAFDMLHREDGLLPSKEDRMVFVSILSTLNFDQAYSLLLQKDVKKPKALSSGLKDKCFIDAYTEFMDDQTNDEAQKRLKNISGILTLPDVKTMLDKADDPKMVDYLFRLYECLNMSISPLQKESAVHRAITGFINRANHNMVHDLKGVNLSMLRNGGMGPKE